MSIKPGRSGDRKGLAYSTLTKVSHVALGAVEDAELGPTEVERDVDGDGEDNRSDSGLREQRDTRYAALRSHKPPLLDRRALPYNARRRLRTPAQRPIAPPRMAEA